jgi:DNA-binding transcriptional ArsR family regulator
VDAARWQAVEAFQRHGNHVRDLTVFCPGRIIRDHSTRMRHHLGIDLSDDRHTVRPHPLSDLPGPTFQEARRSMHADADTIDSIFRALSDATRRRVVERLNRGPASVSELAEPFAMALPSFVQHLRVLEDCGLVFSRKTGRVRSYQLAPKRLKTAEDWLTRQRTLWERRLDQLDSYLATLKPKDKQP